MTDPCLINHCFLGSFKNLAERSEQIYFASHLDKQMKCCANKTLIAITKQTQPQQLFDKNQLNYVARISKTHQLSNSANCSTIYLPVYSTMRPHAIYILELTVFIRQTIQHNARTPPAHTQHKES
jgi:hypothetical protein